MDNHPKQITREEYQRIMALPQRTFRVGGGTRTGKYDEESRQFYELDEDGRLTGNVATVNQPAPKPEPTQGEPDSPAEPSEDEPMDEPADDEAEAASGKKKKRWLIIGGVALCLVFVIIAAVGMMGGKSAAPSDSVDGAGDAEAPAAEVHVIRVNADLLPGHLLTPEDVEDVVLDRATYDEITLYGRDLYDYGNLDMLVGSYLTKYVPEGQYLEQEDLQAASPFAINPWGGTEAGTVSVAVNLDPDLAADVNFGWGSNVELTIRRVTTSQVAVGGEEVPEPSIPGMTHTSVLGTTSSTEEITIGDLHVTDLLNANGESIYERYCAYMGIPLGRRLDYITKALQESDTLLDELTPAQAVIRITEEQAAYIGDVHDANTTATIQSLHTLYTTTNEQMQFASEAAAVKNTIFQAQAVKEKLLAEEQAKLAEAMRESAQEESENG